MKLHPRDKCGRDKIRAGVILDRLQKCALGEIELTASQIQSAKILLAKVMPDLRASDINATVDNRVTHVTVTRKRD
jgi:hypothetical protein